MLSSELEFCLNEAFQRARQERHEFITVEHLLLALLDTPAVVEVLKSCGADPLRLRRELKEFIEDSTPRLRAADEAEQDVQPTLGFQRVLQRAVFHVQSSGRKEVTPINVLVAIFSEKQSQAVYLLGLQDVARLDVVNYISHGVSKTESGKPDEDLAGGLGGEREGGEASALEVTDAHLDRIRAVDGSVRVWDATTGVQLLMMQVLSASGRGQAINSAEFSSDGSLIVGAVRGRTPTP